MGFGLRNSRTLLRTRHVSRSIVLGGSLLAFGLLLVAAGFAYYTYTFLASRDLDRLNVQVPARETPTEAPSGDTPVEGLPGLGGLYPGGLLPARQWADPRGTLDLGQGSLLEGFTPFTGPQSDAGGAFERADRIIIPALDLDATVDELGIVDVGDSRQYETPKFTVGHIPTTSHPGSAGNGWYFGHLESPVQDEGNVFARLPKIPDLLRAGEDVYVILQTDTQQYLYHVFQTNLIHQDDLRLTRSEDARVTLVTCFPRLKYDHRLLVSASLIGFREIGSA